MSIKFACFFSMILSVSQFSFGQFKNIKLDEQRADNLYACEPSISINPRDTKNIVAASLLDNVYYTKDGGLTWQKSKLQSPWGVYGDPSLVVDGKGTFYYFHLSDPTHGSGDYSSEKLDRIVVHQSDDGGVTWSTGESIGLNHPKDQDKEWATVDTKGNIHVTWTQFDKYGDKDSNCQSVILYSKSKNGKKWTEPIQISQTPGNCVDDDNTAEGAVPAVTFDGKIFVAWSNQGKIFLDRSFDGSQWLTNDIAITEQPGGWNFKIPGHDRCNGMPVLMVDNSKGGSRGTLYLMWADQRNGEHDTDIWFMRSSNFGDNWTPVMRVNDDGKGKHQYLPWITIDQATGYLYSIFYDRRAYDDMQTDVYIAYSTNAGRTFENVKISEVPFTPSESEFFGDYTNIAAHKGIITPIWTRMDNGKTSVWTSIIKHEELVKAYQSKK
jgi:hypothetical protein